MLSGDTGSLSTLASSSSAIQTSPSRRIIDHLTLNTDFSGMKSSISKSSSLSIPTTKSSTSSLNSTGTAHSSIITPSHSPRKLESIQNISTFTDNSKDAFSGVKERLIAKIDPVEMTIKPTIITVPQDTVKRSAMLLAGSKFRLNIKKIPENKLKLNSVTLYSISVTGASMSFHSYDADRNDDFARYPCDVRLDGYRLIVQLASKQWSEEKKSDKEVKFIGCREYLIKEARMMLVPEATLTRSKYWMNDYPIVIQDLQILDKQIYSKQQLEKSKLDTNDFFKNNATTLSIWFETGPQKEEWFHKLSLVLRKGKEEIERVKYLLAASIGSLSSSISNTYLNRRQAQTDADTVLVSNPVTEANIRASVIETQLNAEELQQRVKINIINCSLFCVKEKEPENTEKDASGTHRTIARKSKKITPNEASLQKVLQTPECLDEAAITINFMTRRLLCDMFHTPVFKDLLKNKVEMKLKEIAVSILENLRVVSIDLGKTFPIILKIEPMQWNTQGIWFNLFLYYRGNFKLSIKSRVILQKLINYDSKNDKPIFAQHQTSQIVHQDNEHINEDDLIQRQKLLAKEPEVPEMAVTRKLGTILTNLALNKYFQMFVNLPFVKTLFEKFSQQDVGIDVELTSFSGVLTLNIPPPPSDRIWVGFPEMPDLNIKVTPTYGEKKYSYILLQDFLAAKARAELKRLVVLPAMDDQLLPFFRDWVIDIIGNIVAKPVNPLTDNYKAKLNVQTAVREGLQEYKNAKNVKRQSPVLSTGSETTRTQT
ncbi:unnamed protein product [Rotaria sp. Silwood2]|nr:unnamed protein product [Rotaria sp. Silwood2]CAF3968641.1 unnamed protein product [Rotaria sp. Silwood2]